MNKIISINLIENNQLNINCHLFRLSDMKIIFIDNNYYLKNGLDKILIKDGAYVEVNCHIYKLNVIDYLDVEKDNIFIKEDIFHKNTILDRYYLKSKESNVAKKSNQIEKLTNNNLLPSKRMFDIPRYKEKPGNENNKSFNITKKVIKVSKTPIDEL